MITFSFSSSFFFFFLLNKNTGHPEQKPGPNPLCAHSLFSNFWLVLWERCTMCLESIHLPPPARLSFTSFPRSQNSISSIQLTQQVQLLPLRTYLAWSATILLRSQVLRHWGLRHVYYFFYVCIRQPTMKQPISFHLLAYFGGVSVFVNPRYVKPWFCFHRQRATRTRLAAL